MVPYPSDKQNPYMVQYINAITTPMAIAAGIFPFTKDLIPVAAPVRTIIIQIKGNAIFPFKSRMLTPINAR